MRIEDGWLESLIRWRFESYYCEEIKPDFIVVVVVRGRVCSWSWMRRTWFWSIRKIWRYSTFNRSSPSESGASAGTMEGTWIAYWMPLTRLIGCLWPGLLDASDRGYLMPLTGVIWCLWPGLFDASDQDYLMPLTRVILCLWPGLFDASDQGYLICLWFIRDIWLTMQLIN